MKKEEREWITDEYKLEHMKFWNCCFMEFMTERIGSQRIYVMMKKIIWYDSHIIGKDV